MNGNEIVTAPELARPVGYAHAVRAGAGRTVYLGGQTAQRSDGTIAGRTLVEQFEQAAINLVAALRAAGGSPADLVSLQIFVTDVDEYRRARAELGRVWHASFGRHYPAIGLFGVTSLFDAEAVVELMGVAVVGEPGSGGPR